MKWLLQKIILVSFWVVVVLSLLLAIFSLGFSKILPYLDHYRPQIESNLHQITGYPVHLGDIQGHLEGIDPTISISHFELLTNNEVLAVSIDEMQIRLDAVQSLLTLSPQFTYIRFVKPTIAVQESEGQWRLQGSQSSRTMRNDVGVKRILDYLSEQRNFSISDAKLKVNSEEFGRHEVFAPSLYIFQKTFGSLINSTFYLDGSLNPFKIDARLDKAHSFSGSYRLKASIKAPTFSLPLEKFYSTTPYSLSSIQAEGDIWLDILLDKEVEVRAESTNIHVAFTDGEEFKLSPSLKLRYSQERPNLRIDMANVIVQDKAGKRSPATDLSFDWSSLTGRSSARFQQVDLALLARTLPYFLLEDSRGKDLLVGLSPKGIARNGTFQIWREDGKLDFDLLTNLTSTSVLPHQGIPKATDINGVFHLTNDGGYIDFFSQNSSIQFEELYDKSWKVESVSGYVDWRRQQDTFLLTGRDLSVQRNGAHIEGGFRLEVREDQADWIALDFKARNVSSIDKLTYIPPNILNKSLTDWIQSALSDKGVADSVDLLVHSQLHDEVHPHARMLLSASDIDVRFDDNWPLANDVNGVFELKKSGVSVQVDSASMAGLSVSDVSLDIPVNEGKVEWLSARGKITEDVALIRQALNKTPLQDGVLKPFRDWDLQGIVSGELDLSIPLVEGASPNMQLAINFKDNDLLIEDLNLFSEITNGRLQYSSAEGVTDSFFDLKSLSGQSRLILSSENSSDNRLVVYGGLSGEVDLRKVAEWQNVPATVAENFSGTVAYNGALVINKDKDGDLGVVLDTDLIGAKIDFPSPVGKLVESSRDFKLIVQAHDNTFDIIAQYDDLADFYLSLVDGELFGGDILVHAAASNKTLNTQRIEGIALRGQVDQISLEDWVPAIEGIIEGGEGNTSLSPTTIPDGLKHIDLLVDAVKVNSDNTLHNFKLSYDKEASQNILLDSDEINLSLSYSEDGIPDLHFDFLSWNVASDEKSEEVVSEGIPSAPISVQQIPDMTVSIDQLYLNHQAYGDWAFSLMSEGALLSMEPISSKLRKGDFKGKLLWLDDGDRSKVDLSIKVEGSNLDELAGKFSDESVVSSKEFEIDVALNWQGHPFFFDRESAVGSIRFSAEEGNFNQVDKLPAFLKVLGIFNVGSLKRRLTLDFSDVYEPGLTYDEFKGALSLKNGIVKTISPITVISPSAELELEGEADIVNEILNEKLTASFPFSSTLPFAGLLFGTPQIAGFLYLTDKLIGNQLSKMTSVEYEIVGPFDAPKIEPIKSEN